MRTMRWNERWKSAWAVLLLALGAISCGTGAESPGPHAVDVGGRTLQVLRQGKGTPVVVIEAGMGEPPLESGSWQRVVGDLSKDHEVVLYNRAGLGGSDPAPQLPRSSKDVASDLHRLLERLKLKGPFLLVGHSFGGLHLRVFASEYPDDVAALVLVDATHPDQDDRWLSALPKPRAGEPEPVLRARQFLQRRRHDPQANPERIDPKVSATQANSGRGLGDKPLVILTHHADFKIDPSLPADVSAVMEKVWQDLAEEMKGLSTRSTLHRSRMGGHALQAEDPDLVVAGIREAASAVKGTGLRR